jgi:hypothetical protein
MNELLRIEGAIGRQDRDWGMPDEETIQHIQAATASMLANEIPGFQIGPNIGGSMLGVLATLDVIQDVTSKQLQQNTDHNTSDIFRYTNQMPRPIHNELSRIGPAVPYEFMEMYRLPPHVDLRECGLAVHLQSDAVVREVQLAHLRDEKQPLTVEKTIGNVLAPRAVQYTGLGISDEQFADYVGSPIHRGETSQGVMTIFSEGNMDFPSLDGKLRTSIHFFKNPPRNTTSSWTRLTGKEADHLLAPDAIEQKNGTFLYRFMHLHAAQAYKQLRGEHGLHPEDIGQATLAASPNELANVLHMLQADGMLSPDSAVSLQRYINHPGHADNIAYAEDCGPFLLYEYDL